MWNSWRHGSKWMGESKVPIGSMMRTVVGNSFLSNLVYLLATSFVGSIVRRSDL